MMSMVLKNGGNDYDNITAINNKEDRIIMKMKMMERAVITLIIKTAMVIMVSYMNAIMIDNSTAYQ